MEGEFDNPVSDTFEDETVVSPAAGKGGKLQYANPVPGDTETELFEDESTPTADAVDPLANDAKTADLDHEMTDDDLSDLTYAFQAMDVSNDGTIEPPELLAMMRVLGADIAIEDVQKLFYECKQEFAEWLEAHERGTSLPEYMVHTHEEAGAAGSTKHGGARHNTELNIDRTNKQHPVFSRMKRLGRNPAIAYTVGAPLKAADKILAISYGLAKNAVPQSFGSDGTAKGRAQELEELHELQLHDQHLIFAEYVHMMASQNLVQKHCPGDWHKECHQMRQFRGAFDTADVDGDDSLEFDELEMVVTAMDPHHSLTHEDMLYLWDIMCGWAKENNPEKANADGTFTLNFTEYLHGMADVKKHEKCKDWLDVNKPNKWELLSLLIDTPVSQLEEKQILANLDGIEKMGIAMIKRDLLPMDKERMKGVLNRAGNGELRKLDPSQKERMAGCKNKATLVSGFIGFLLTVVPCAAEMLLIDYLKVDGAKDRYDVCNLYSGIKWDVNETAGESPFMEYPLPDAKENWRLLACSVRPVNASTLYYNSLFDETMYYGVDTTVDTGYWDSLKIQRRDEYYDSKAYLPANWDGDALCLPGKTWQDEYENDKERCANCECEICQCFHHKDGAIGGEVGRKNPVLEFWVILGSMIAINVVFEIALLMYYAVQYCVKVAWALDQRLVPLNADRAFVADSLVRAAFELGNPTSPVLGVDPHTEQAGKLKVLVMVLLYKGKVVLTGLIMKTIFGLVTPAQIRGFGVYTSAELFNEIMEHHFKDESEVTYEGKVEIARGVGVAIVKNGSMYPTMELLLRHSIQYLKLRGKACVSQPGVLDNQEELISTMAPGGHLTDDERIVALSVHLLASILDGDMGHAQMDLWEELCASAGDLAGFYPDRVLYLTTRFRRFEFITAEEIHLCFNPDVTDDARTTVSNGAKCSYCCFQFQNFLTC